MELELGIAGDVRKILQSTQTRLDSLVAARPKSDDSTIIDTIISEICGVVVGQRVEKTTVMHYLKEQMTKLTTRRQLLDYCKFVLQYTTVCDYLEKRIYFAGTWEYVRMNFFKFEAHLPIYITALVNTIYKDADEDLATRLMAGIESFVMRNALTQTQRQASLYFYAKTPKIAQNLSERPLKSHCRQLVLELSDSDANPDDLNALGEETRKGEVPNSMKKNELISAFYVGRAKLGALWLW